MSYSRHVTIVTCHILVISYYRDVTSCRRSTNLLAAGMNGKAVRLIDTKNPGKPAGTTITRATQGLAVDPANEYRLAGHTDNQILIWDTR